MKGYKVDSTFKEKLQNEYNCEYGFTFKNEEETLESLLRTKRIEDSNFIRTKRS